jgi:hypothetical protein
MHAKTGPDAPEGPGCPRVDRRPFLDGFYDAMLRGGAWSILVDPAPRGSGCPDRNSGPNARIL